jgi:hypothetical protein
MVTHREYMIILVSESLEELAKLMHQTQTTNVSSGCIKKKMKEIGEKLIENSEVKEG